MQTVTRYVIVELCKMFAVALGLLTLMMIVVGVVREAAMQHLPIVHVVRLIPYVLPDALRVAVPVTLLLAVSSVYSRMSSSNEVIALKSAGISPWCVVWPTLVFAFVLSLATVWLNDVACSWGREGTQRVVVEAAEDIVYGMLRAQRRYSTPGLSINVQRVVGRRLIRPTISIRAGSDRPAITIIAEEAELTADLQQDLFRVVLRNGTFDVDGQLSVEFPDVQEQTIPLESATRARDLASHPSSIPLIRIPEEIAIQKQRLGELAASGDSPDGAAGAADKQRESRLQDLVQREWERLCRLRTERHRRWSAGFSCLFFVWVGAPMAVWMRNRDFLSSFFLCFLPILIVYYPLLAYGIDGAKNGTIPPWGVWAGNLLLGVWGVTLMKKVVRY
ncbi:MAG: LptF/LptG family permease [Thermoguttaceae bacterium]|jgi:lipopolysaccharide export system permease protein|nr:LptF/LptG family permease [Thermoguttaceae bacterium]